MAIVVGWDYGTYGTHETYGYGTMGLWDYGTAPRTTHHALRTAPSAHFPQHKPNEILRYE